MRVTSQTKLEGQGPWGPSAVGVGFGSVWVGEASGGNVFRVDAASGRIRGTIDLGASFGSGGSFAVGGRDLWLAGSSGVARIDPSTSRVTALYDLGVHQLNGLVADNDTFWFVSGPPAADAAGNLVTSRQHGFLVHVARDGTMLSRTDLGVDVTDGGLTLHGRRMWVASAADPTCILVVPLLGIR